MNWRILSKNCEASLGELNPLEGLNNWLVEKNRDKIKYKTFGLRPG